MLKISLRLILLCLISPVLFTGCAILHHVQVGSIDNRQDEVLIPFVVMVSEVGVSTEEIGKISSAASRNSGGNDTLGSIAAVVSLFQLGPRTGNPVYSPKYAEKLIYEIHQKCPSGKVTGLMSIREMRKYPVISGEIIKVTGFCRKVRTNSNTTSTKDSKITNTIQEKAS